MIALKPPMKEGAKDREDTSDVHSDASSNAVRNTAIHIYKVFAFVKGWIGSTRNKKTEEGRWVGWGDGR